jgi:thiamine biosynthesis lipoprotein
MTTDRIDFRAMGVQATVAVVGGDRAGLALAARSRIDELERRWSRFIADSEVSRLVPGAANLVSQDTYTLVECAVAGWRLTGGRFDPTVRDAVIAAGYDRSFEQLDGRAGATDVTRRSESEPVVVPGCEGIELDPVVSDVRLPEGVRIDPGGIGKGLAADLVVAETMAAGARGVLVNLGGDIRVVGESPDGSPWTVGVEDPFDPEREIARFVMADGAVATSSRRWRRFTGPDGPAHHLVDPRTGRPAEGSVEAATAVGGQGWAAEVYATAAFLAGAVDGVNLLGAAGLDGLVVTADGAIHRPKDRGVRVA